MNYQIKHACKGRIRVEIKQTRMSLAQADLLENWLQTLPQVTRAVVHERTRCAIIEYQAGREELLQSLKRFSYQDKSLEELSNIHTSRALNRAYGEKLVGMVALKAAQSLFLPAPLRMACSVLKSVPYLFRAVRGLLCRKLQVEVLDGVSIGVSILRRDYSTASSVMFLLGLGELLEEWTHKRSVDNLARSMSLNIERVWLKTEDGEVLTPLQKVRAGDWITVRMGGMIPFDGTVAEGEGMVNQSSLTGESIPVEKRPGSLVYAGTVVAEGELVISVTAQSGSSRYDKIVNMIEESEKLKSAAESRAARLADRLVPYTLAGSALVYLLTRNVTRALSVLMVDFSCALKLSMPLSVLSAMSEASRYHITVKGGKYLESVARADTIVFDKTGTLTYATPVVVQVIPFGGHRETDMLRLAACLEEHFPHSIANAVVQAAKDRGLVHEELHSQVEYIVAHGIASAVKGERVVIGSAHFVFKDEGCIVPPMEQAAFEALPRQYSHLYLAIDGVLAAVICISDPLREEAAEVMDALHRLGVSKIVMLTGDSERTAAAIAAQVGADAYQAEVLPEDKARFVQQAHQQGHTVMMVGDGINDSPALSAADAGIAISGGAAIAREIADITIAADDLFELVKLRILAQHLMERIQANYRFVIGFNGSLIALGSAGILAPAASAMLHNLSTLGLSLHSMTRLLSDS